MIIESMIDTGGAVILKQYYFYENAKFASKSNFYITIETLNHGACFRIMKKCAKLN